MANEPVGSEKACGTADMHIRLGKLLEVSQITFTIKDDSKHGRITYYHNGKREILKDEVTNKNVRLTEEDFDRLIIDMLKSMGNFFFRIKKNVTTGTGGIKITEYTLVK